MKIIKQLLLVVLAAGYTQLCQAQLLKVENGSTLTVLPGTLLTIDGLSLTPSLNCDFTNCSLTKTTAVGNTLNTNYIQRVYTFSGTVPVFSGTVKINYSEGSELNGISETSLQLYAYSNGGWAGYTGSNNSADNDVTSNALTGLSLTELTLGAPLVSLPVYWLEFSVQKLTPKAFLKWRTAQEQNSKDFVVQHSTDAFNWQHIGIVAAAGNSTSISSYSFIHSSPVCGTNYYRLQQRDLDGKTAYSSIQRLMYSAETNDLQVINNPVRNNLLQVQLIKPGNFMLFNQQGQLLFAKQLAAGMQTVDVGRYTAGIYFIRSGDQTRKILIE